MEEKKKIPRSSREKNYSDRECLQLIRTVQKYAHIIECKLPRQYKNDERTATWDQICREFNMKTNQNRLTLGLRSKWKNDKSNVRDYLQYLQTSHSRSGRSGKDIPKPKFFKAMAEVMGIDCPELEQMPDDLCMNGLDNSEEIVKMEQTNEPPDMSVEEIMINETADQFNCPSDDSMSVNSSHIPHTTKNNILPNSSINLEIHELQVELLKKQILVQDLMAAELRAKIERTQQLMKMEMTESELRCEEIKKRMNS